MEGEKEKIGCDVLSILDLFRLQSSMKKQKLKVLQMPFQKRHPSTHSLCLTFSSFAQLFQAKVHWVKSPLSIEIWTKICKHNIQGQEALFESSEKRLLEAVFWSIKKELLEAVFCS